MAKQVGSVPQITATVGRCFAALLVLVAMGATPHGKHHLAPPMHLPTNVSIKYIVVSSRTGLEAPHSLTPTEFLSAVANKLTIYNRRKTAALQNIITSSAYRPDSHYRWNDSVRNQVDTAFELMVNGVNKTYTIYVDYTQTLMLYNGKVYDLPPHWMDRILEVAPCMREDQLMND